MEAAGGCQVIGSGENIGIGPAYRALVEAATTEFILFLECDWRLTGDSPVEHVEAALSLIRRGSADVVRLRSRTRPGWPVNETQFQNRELSYPRWLLGSALYEPRPERLFPGLIRDEEGWLLASSQYANWTNNPHLARRSFVVDHVLPWCGEAGIQLEGLIDEYWDNGGFKVAQGRGLFTHERLDGPRFRAQSLTSRIGYWPRIALRRHLRRIVASRGGARARRRSPGASGV